MPIRQRLKRTKSAAAQPLEALTPGSSSDVPYVLIATGRMGSSPYLLPDGWPKNADSGFLSVPPKINNATTLWPGLETLLAVLKPSADEFGPLALAIDELARRVNVFESAGEGREVYDELRVELNSLLEILGQFLDGPMRPTMTMSMKNFSIGICEELELVQQKCGSGMPQKYAGIFGTSEEMLKCCCRIQERLKGLVLNADPGELGGVDEQVMEARLHSLSPSVSALYNFAKSELVHRRLCTPLTRTQELAELHGWARGETNDNVYWVNGMAGTGKTTIAYSLCAELEEVGQLGASFFCSRSIPECQSVQLILPTIAYQLARFSHPFKRALSQTLKTNPGLHTQTLEAQFEALLAKPLSEVKATLPANVVVVIDALDECQGGGSVGRILDVILAHSGSGLPVRFLISSRPEPEIYDRMMGRVGDHNAARLTLHELDAQVVQSDITKYLESELRGLCPSHSQINALVEQSGAWFTYAAATVQSIKSREREMQSRLETALSSLGHNGVFDALFKGILKKAFDDTRIEASGHELMKTIINTVACVQEPMTVTTLARLLNLCTEQVDYLLRPLYSVLNVPETTGLVTILHSDFLAFLLDRRRSVTFYCDPATNHRKLAQTCFGIIEANEPRFNICGLESSYLYDDQVTDLTDRTNCVVSPELFYACRYWIAHLELGTPNTQLRQLFQGFLSAQLLLWMEVLNLKRIMKLGVRIIQRAESWSRTHDCSTETIELAHDAWRFITIFTAHSISKSTPHIYVSMLLFWPQTSPITKHYMDRMRGAIKTEGTAVERRQLSLLTTWPFEDHVQLACFSPDGSLVAAGASSSVYVTDGTTGEAVLAPLKHKSLVTSVAFSPDGTLIAVGSEDNAIQVWRAQNGQPLGEPLVGHTSFVLSVSFSPNSPYVISGSADRTIRVWHIQSGQTVIGPLKGHTGWVYSICLSHDGTRIASGSSDETLRVWDTSSGRRILGPLGGHTGDITSVRYSPDDTRIVSGSEDNKILVWSAVSGQLVAGPFEGHSRLVWSVGFSPDGCRITSGSADYTIRLWDIVRGESRSVAILRGHAAPVRSVEFSPDGMRLVSASSDKTVRLWDPRTPAPNLGPSLGHTGAVTCVGFSSDCNYIVSSSGDETIRMWDVRGGNMVVKLLQGHTDWIRSVCFSPNGTRLISGSMDRTILVWDVQNDHSMVGRLSGHTRAVNSVCFSPDGCFIASGSADKTIRLWDARLGDGMPAIATLRGHTNDINSVCFSPDGTRIVSGSNDKTIRMWCVPSGQNATEPLEGHTGWVYSVCFSPDGTRIASGSGDKTVLVWDAQSGETVFDPLEGHTGNVNSVCYSSDGTLIVSGSRDRTVRLWDARSGQALGDLLAGHTGPVNSVAFSPDNMHIVSGSDDQTIRLWNVRDLLRMQGTPDSPQSRHAAPISQPHSPQAWVLREDGWLSDSRSRLLAWVPPDLHTSLLHPCNTLLISTRGYLRLDFGSAVLGESWTD